MAVIPFYEPELAGQPNNAAFNQVAYLPAQNASWRRGSILQLVTTGNAVSTPSGGTGASVTSGTAGPTFGAPVSLVTVGQTVTNTGGIGNNANSITVTGIAAAGAPALTYYIECTYTLTGNESLTGLEFVVNCAPGIVPGINVLAGTAPTGATNFAVYASIYPQAEDLQQATKTTTALGTSFSLAYPLANSQGINLSVTNPSSNIVGFAVNSSAADFYSGTGGSNNVNEASLFGATTSQPPLGYAEAYLAYVVKLQNAQLLEISFKQQWSPLLIGTTTGLTLDTASGFFVADQTASNKILTITGSSDGVYGVQGNGTETSGKRILVYFNQGLV